VQINNRRKIKLDGMFQFSELNSNSTLFQFSE